MDILYLWVEEYGCLKNIGLNFGGKYVFEYDMEVNTLSVRDNENYLKDFFDINGSNSVSNVTGIFGKNGVGKSTILSLIKQLVQSYESTKYIVVSIEVKSNKVWISTNLSKPSLKSFENINTGWNLDKWFSRFMKNYNTKFIYYSNIFDTKNELEYEEFINISTNYLCRNYRNYQLDMEENPIPASEIEAYKRKELQLQIKFVNQFQDDFIDEKSPLSEIVPTGIIMSIRTNYIEDEILFSKLVELVTDENLINLFQMLRNRYVEKARDHRKEVIRQKTEKGHALTSSRNYDWFGYIVNAVFHYFNNLYKLTPAQQKSFLLIPTIPDKLLKENSDLEMIVTNLVNYLRTLDEGIFDSKTNLIKIISNINNNRSSFTQDRRTFTNSELASSEIIPLLAQCFKTSSPFEFSWNGLSSGEQSLLTIFSRFFDKREDVKDKNLVILLDEPTVFMHPDWERKLLFSLIVGLPKVLDLNKNQKIQIIITSNNPIIASDLPANNVILLGKTNNNDKQSIYKYSPKVVDDKEKIQTFGANIHSLYMNTFFLNDGFIGEFSKKKIEQLYKEIEAISKDDLSRKDEFTRRIDMIAEKVIKNMLKTLLNYRLRLKND